MFHHGHGCRPKTVKFCRFCSCFLRRNGQYMAIYCIFFIRRCFLACLFCDNHFLHSMFLAAMFYRSVIMFPNKNEVPYFVQTQNNQIVGDVPLYCHYYWCISHISPYLLLKAAKKRHRFPCFPSSAAAFFWPWFCGAALAQRCIWAVAEFDTPCCVKWWYTGDIVWYYGRILTKFSAHISNIILLVKKMLRGHYPIWLQ